MKDCTLSPLYIYIGIMAVVESFKCVKKATQLKASVSYYMKQLILHLLHGFGHLKTLKI